MVLSSLAAGLHIIGRTFARYSRICHSIRGSNSSSSGSTKSSPVNAELLKLLVCPISKAPLRYDSATNELVCDKIGVAYPILDGGIPNLVPQDARILDTSEQTT